MATINDLGLSVSEMTDEQLLERLKDMRQSRRTHKAPVKRAARAVKPTELKASNLTEGQASNLITELEEMMKS